jgi:phage tail-like protein
MANYYPPVGFHFKVEVLGLPANDFDVRFTEVGGLSAELATEEVPEGGENRFIQKYPARAKYPELVLKRGLLRNSEVWKWVRECVEDLKITPKSVDIKLLNENHEPLMTWHVIGAYPTKWAASDLNATNNAVVIETLQLYFQYFTVEKS